jgi:hypothetical protein
MSALDPAAFSTAAFSASAFALTGGGPPPPTVPAPAVITARVAFGPVLTATVTVEP